MTHLFSPWISAIILTLAFAFADGFNGGQFGWNRLSKDHGGPLHGRGIYYVALPLAAICYLIGGWPALCLGVIWGFYRAALGFPTGTLTGRDIEATVLRHALLWPFVFAVLAFYALSVWAVFPFLAYTGAAVCLAKWNGDAAKTGHDVNAEVEPIRGAAYGLAVAIALAVS
jgi:hypothetical protein